MQLNKIKTGFFFPLPPASSRFKQRLGGGSVMVEVWNNIKMY